MPWSTRELAELAGTTVNTIRHYHRLGLLEVPERRYNGYKEYETRHLVSLLRTRRLANLGVPLSKIAEISGDADGTPDALREVDAEVQERIAHLQQVRADIAGILRDDAPADAPAGFTGVASKLSDADSSMIHIYTRLYDQDALDDVREMIENDTDGVNAEIDALSADADQATRDELVERLVPTLAQRLIDYPWLSDPAAHLAKGEEASRQTFAEAVAELHNPAQLDVLARASMSAAERVRELRDPESAH
jgi:DNA-binding transcriptional MerR regulator